MSNIGIWIIGAKGGVSTTMIVGALAIKNELRSTVGLVTENEPINQLDLVNVEDLVFGGYEIRKESLWEEALDIDKQTGTFGKALLDRLKGELDEVDKNIKTGITINCGKTINDLTNVELEKDELTVADQINEIQNDLNEFVETHELDNLIMLNLASTEPTKIEFLTAPEVQTAEAFEEAIENNNVENIAASTIYAYAAIDAGFPYINFTPSPGSEVKALRELALQKGVPHMGKDGKTGETLVKSALAPMFLNRNMRVLSWAGFNILGDRDGKILDDPSNKATKIKSKDQTMMKIFNYPVFSRVGIEYVPSLHDWKTAWDHIHFNGFLDTKMVMQFIWQGCDAILAAPLALDLVRLADFAIKNGEKGLMPQTACFFKSPLEVDEFDFFKQYNMLVEYANTHLKSE
jgi:myo-inositol-1-phosphate synthase